MNAVDGPRPSWLFYLFSPLAFLLGVGMFVLFLLAGVHRIDRSLTRAIVPGKTTIHLMRQGTNTVFYEHRSRAGGRTFDTGRQAPTMHCEMERSNDHTKIAFRRPHTSTNYSTTTAAGYSVLAFDLAEPGDYDFSCNYRDGASGGEVVMAIGPDITWTIFRMVFAGLGAIFCGFAAAVVIGVAVYMKRNPRRPLQYASIGQGQVKP